MARWRTACPTPWQTARAQESDASEGAHTLPWPPSEALRPPGSKRGATPGRAHLDNLLGRLVRVQTHHHAALPHHVRHAWRPVAPLALRLAPPARSAAAVLPAAAAHRRPPQLLGEERPQLRHVPHVGQPQVVMQHHRLTRTLLLLLLLIVPAVSCSCTVCRRRLVPLLVLLLLLLLLLLVLAGASRSVQHLSRQERRRAPVRRRTAAAACVLPQPPRRGLILLPLHPRRQLGPRHLHRLRG